MLGTPSYYMQDQARDKVKRIMGERWLPSPAGAFWTLLALVSALSIVGSLESGTALQTLAQNSHGIR